jgi:phospholipase D1/2
VIDRIDQLLAPVRDSAWLPWALLVVFLVAGLLWIGVWFVIMQTAVLLDPPLSIALASASTFFALGRGALGPLVRRRASARVQATVSGVGLEHVVALRIVPLLPYTGVNLAMGAFGVPWRTFLVGTVLGMAPGIFAITLLGERAVAVVKDPTPTSVAVLVVGAIVLVVAGTQLRRWARARQAAQGRGGGDGS